MAAEVAHGRELTQLAPDHFLRHLKRYVAAAIADADRVTDQLGNDTAGARSRLATAPAVAMQVICTRRISPLGRRRVAQLPSLAISCAPVPALRTIWAPRPGCSSMLWITVPVGMSRSARALPGISSASGPD